MIEWSLPARDDLKGIITHIHRDDPATAQSVARRLLQTIEKLNGFPGLGRPGRVEGTRELVVSGLPYIIPYAAAQGRVVILRILHTAMHRPID